MCLFLRYILTVCIPLCFYSRDRSPRSLVSKCWSRIFSRIRSATMRELCLPSSIHSLIPVVLFMGYLRKELRESTFMKELIVRFISYCLQREAVTEYDIIFTVYCFSRVFRSSHRSNFVCMIRWFSSVSLLLVRLWCNGHLAIWVALLLTFESLGFCLVVYQLSVAHFPPGEHAYKRLVSYFWSSVFQ